MKSYYHASSHGLEKNDIFKSREDFIAGMNDVAICILGYDVSIVCFCLMSNHFHFLLYGVLSECKRFAEEYKRRCGMRMRASGDVQGLREVDIHIDHVGDHEYLENVIAYILRNAVCAKICRRVDEYPWSSYGAYFQTGSYHDRFPIATLKGRRRKAVLKTRMNLDDCPYYVDAEGNITVDSFVKSEVVHHAFNWSGKLFLFCLGCCNDSQMEYELVSRPMVRASDQDLLFAVEEYVSRRFKGKTISVLTTSEKCSILKRLFYEYKSSVPQLSRVLGLPRDLVRKVLAT